jgi:hypothetical protein
LVLEPDGVRYKVTEITIDQAPSAPHPDTKILLAVPDFVAFGGDSFVSGGHCVNMHVSNVRLRDSVRQLLAKVGHCDLPSHNIVAKNDSP